jgi:hypothetical protein
MVFLPGGEGEFDLQTAKGGEAAAGEVAHGEDGLLGIGAQPDGDAVVKYLGPGSSRGCHTVCMRATLVLKSDAGGLAIKIYSPETICRT